MVVYIVRDDATSAYLGVWDIGTREAVRLDVSNAREGPGTYYKAGDGEDLWAALDRLTPWRKPESLVTFHETALAPGQYYPRMARRQYRQQDEKLGWCPDASKEKSRIAIARGQMSALIGQLARICQTVHPVPKTFDTHGHDIRNLLILACTEVEAHWRAVLEANGAGAKSTKDYVKLCPAMRLGDYGVAFNDFPWLKSIHPFAGWEKSGGGSTKSLPWYAAYNAVKHDRENQFELATLGSAFAAVSACFIMILAQYGDPAHSFGSNWLGRSFFSLAARPNWSHSDVYMRSFDETDWQSVAFPF